LIWRIEDGQNTPFESEHMNDKTIADFVLAKMPEIHFGAGKLSRLPQLIRQKACRVLLVTGSASFRQSAHYDKLTHALAEADVHFFEASVTGEPSPAFVDQTVERYRDERLNWVIAIGGGSAIDAGKAISAMLPHEGSVRSYLEGMETKKHDGRKIPFMAVPTSSGTGSEATKNAVLSEVGAHGFKSSLRHDHFVPDIALVDPELMLSCPPGVTAACGLDALTQLLESYVSTKASPITDALAMSGLEHVSAGFLPAFARGATDIEARSHMAYAALLSGITLANAGLGLVHGFAGPIGGYSRMPHGAVCGTLIGESTRITLEALFENAEKNRIALEKFARAGALLSGRSSVSLKNDCDLLIQTLQEWIELTRIPRLRDFDITQADFPKILDKTNGKNSPAELSREQMTLILEARL
jgi:alcohol dehydrogenase class IV